MGQRHSKSAVKFRPSTSQISLASTPRSRMNTPQSNCAKVLIFWDFENIPFDNPQQAASFVEIVRDEVRCRCDKQRTRYNEVVFEIYSDMSKLDPMMHKAIASINVSLKLTDVVHLFIDIDIQGVKPISIHNGRKNELDLKMIATMNSYQVMFQAQPCDGFLVLIAGDSDYAHTLHSYRNGLGWTVLLICYPNSISARLNGCYSEIIDVNALRRRLTPDGASQRSRSTHRGRGESDSITSRSISLAPDSNNRRSHQTQRQCWRWLEPNHDRTRCNYQHPKMCNDKKCTSSNNCKFGHAFCTNPTTTRRHLFHCKCGRNKDPKLRHILKKNYGENSTNDGTKLLDLNIDFLKLV